MKPTTNFFNADAFIALFESRTGKTVNDGLRAFIRDAEPLIQAAYERGFLDGREAAHG